MAVIRYAPRAFSDLERLCEFLAHRDPGAAEQTVELILTAVEILGKHPFIGRAAEAGLRELVISRGKSGYLALHRYDEELGRVLVLSIRHQREAGYIGQ